jgi:hypothetical protein
MSLSRRFAIVCTFSFALLLFFLMLTVEQAPSQQAREGEAEKAAKAEPPKPPADIAKLTDPPSADGFEDQGSGEGNMPFFDDFSWRAFVALNWPAEKDKRGIPDKTKKFGDTTVRNTVWESWKEKYEVIPPEGQEPTPWDSFEAIVPFEKKARKEGGKIKVLGDITKFQDFHQAGFGRKEAPLIDQLKNFVRYEARMNRTEYNFILQKKLYKKDVLIKQDKIKFPDLSIEVKAAWRELPNDPTLWARFYHKKALVSQWDKDDKICYIEREVGLVGFHIVAKTPQRANWIWSTFEHVDNLSGSHPSFSSKADLPFPSTGVQKPKDWETIKPGKPPVPDPVEVARWPKSDSPNSTKAIDRGYREHRQIKDTIWHNYRLVRTQWPIKGGTSDDDFFPENSVANVTMETYQQKTSCMDCHQSATHCHFVYFLEMTLFPEEAGKHLQSVIKDLKKTKSKKGK